MTETLTDSLKDLSDNDKGFRYVKSGAGNVLNVLGGIISSGGGRSSNDTISKKSETAVCHLIHDYAKTYRHFIFDRQRNNVQLKFNYKATFMLEIRILLQLVS